jgi:hypothetical protein
LLRPVLIVPRRTDGSSPAKACGTSRPSRTRP